MCTENLLRELNNLPFILVKGGAVIEVSQQFVNITQFTRDEFLNHDIEHIFKALKVGPDINIGSIDETADYFLFTKSLEVKQVNIRVTDMGDEKVYTFIENAAFNLEDKFPFVSKMYLDNYYGIAIFSLPDITLLKANDTYISFFDKPNNQRENCLGKQLSEIANGFEGSSLEKMWKDIIATGQANNSEEYGFDGIERGITYWKNTMMPMHEDGKLKYCIVMATDVTDQVIQREKIEEQAKIIQQQNNQLETNRDVTETKRMEHELKQQKGELQEIIQSIDDAIYIYDGNKNFYLVNTAGKKLFYNTEFSDFEALNSNTPYKYYDENGDEITSENLVVSRVLRGEVVVNYKMIWELVILVSMEGQFMIDMEMLNLLLLAAET